MLTLDRLRERLSLQNRIASYLKRTALLAAALFAVGGLITWWPTLSDWMEPETTGTIFVDSPEVYTRERLVNDRYVQDAWLRDKLKSLDTMSPSTQLAKIEATIAGLTDKGINTAEIQKALDGAAAPGTTIGPGAEFKLHNAVRELIRQEIVENQLDDRHDLLGNTMFLLKFDAAVMPGSKTSKNALIKVQITSPSQADPYPVSGELGVIEDFYESESLQPPAAKKYKWAWRLFEDWSTNLQQRVTARSNAIYGEITNPDTARPRILENFLYFVVSFQDQLAFTEVPGCGSLPFGRPGSVDDVGRGTGQGLDALKCLLKDPDGQRSIRPYLSIFSTKAAIESEVGVRLTSRVFSSMQPSEQRRRSAELQGRQIFDFDGPFAFKTQISQDENPKSPPKIIVNTSNPTYLAVEQRCYAEIIAPAAAQLPRHFESDIFNLVQYVKGKGSETYVLGLTPQPRVLLNGQLDDSADLNFAASQTETLGKITQINLAPVDLTKKSFMETLAQYLRGRLSYLYFTRGTSSNQAEFENFEAFYKPIQNQVEEKKCGLRYFFVPVTYFDFVNRLLNPAPFSYAVLPKYEADIEQIESGAYREFVLANVLQTIAGKAGVDADIKAQLARFQSAQQTRPRTTLIGFGYQDSDPNGASGNGAAKRGAVPSFGWLIAPDRGIEKDIDSFRFQPLQKSLSALVSIPAWWTEINVDVETSWVGPDGAAEPAKCAELKNDAAVVVPSCYRYTIGLPTDMQLLDDLIVKTSNRVPTIDALDVPDEVNVGLCHFASIAIPGSRLWRSATVTLGGQEATRIVVLPNMRGILAEFDKIRTTERRPDLIVWTSVGSVKYPGRIVVHPGDDSCLKAKP
jgi:hypothetical protein